MVSDKKTDSAGYPGRRLARLQHERNEDVGHGDGPTEPNPGPTVAGVAFAGDLALDKAGGEPIAKAVQLLFCGRHGIRRFGAKRRSVTYSDVADKPTVTATSTEQSAVPRCYNRSNCRPAH